MKKGNNNSPPPHVLEYWIKGLLKDGTVINKKKIQPNNIISKNTEDKKKDDDEDILYINLLMVIIPIKIILFISISEKILLEKLIGHQILVSPINFLNN
jgi:hypothetical protein